MLGDDFFPYRRSIYGRMPSVAPVTTAFDDSGERGLSRGGDAMAVEHQINRRQFMMTASVVGGAFLLGFALPSRRVRAATIVEKPWTSHVAGG